MPRRTASRFSQPDARSGADEPVASSGAFHHGRSALGHLWLRADPFDGASGREPRNIAEGGLARANWERPVSSSSTWSISLSKHWQRLLFARSLEEDHGDDGVATPFDSGGLIEKFPRADPPSRRGSFCRVMNCRSRTTASTSGFRSASCSRSR